jgi:hypothetical protein
METQTERIADLMEIKKNATYSLPIGVWMWLKAEARRRDTDASSVIVELVTREKSAVAA